jgi:hypothetical protein
VSAEVDQRLSDLLAPARGDIRWLTEIVCDARAQQALLKDLGETTFKGRGIKMRVHGPDGKMQIGTLKGST